jgi:uncharacterized BrkB/YihY/UPF0761 family membrane protein
MVLNLALLVLVWVVGLVAVHRVAPAQSRRYQRAAAVAAAETPQLTRRPG